MATTETNTTMISSLKEDANTQGITNNMDTLMQSIVDLSIPLETRMKMLSNFFTENGSDNCIEIINKLGTMYQISGTSSLKKYLIAICEENIVSPFLQSLSAKALWSYDEKDDTGFRAIEIVYKKLGNDIGTPYKLDLIKILLHNTAYQESAMNFFNTIINSDTLECDYRYKIILSLESDELTKHFCKDACLVFLQNANNLPRYRILACQNYLTSVQTASASQTSQTASNSQITSASQTSQTASENVLLSIAQDEKMEYNTRADATDVLLQLGNADIKKVAKQIILKLGTGNYKPTTIYENAQNVHTKEVEESVVSAIEFLQNNGVMMDKGKPITFEFVEKRILKIDKNENIKISLNRIHMDRALYSKFSCSLSHILIYVWSYIIGNKDEDAMKVRLIEELNEMAGTCSSGFASRLINTISGFGDFNLRISWREQIISNLAGRLNARIRDMDDLTLQEKILNQITIDTGNPEDRKHFLKFLRRNLSSLRSELYSEFKEHISDTDFDLYFRAAVSVYETNGYV